MKKEALNWTQLAGTMWQVTNVFNQCPQLMWVCLCVCLHAKGHLCVHEFVFTCTWVWVNACRCGWVCVCTWHVSACVWSHKMYCKMCVCKYLYACMSVCARMCVHVPIPQPLYYSKPVWVTTVTRCDLSLGRHTDRKDRPWLFTWHTFTQTHTHTYTCKRAHPCTCT